MGVRLGAIEPLMAGEPAGAMRAAFPDGGGTAGGERVAETAAAAARAAAQRGPGAAGQPGNTTRFMQEVAALRGMTEVAGRVAMQAGGVAQQQAIGNIVENQAFQRGNEVNATPTLDFSEAFPNITGRTTQQTVINRPPEAAGPGPANAVSAPGPLLRTLESIRMEGRDLEMLFTPPRAPGSQRVDAQALLRDVNEANQAAGPPVGGNFDLRA